jgi:hypothetical protein
LSLLSPKLTFGFADRSTASLRLYRLSQFIGCSANMIHTFSFTYIFDRLSVSSFNFEAVFSELR